MSGPDLYLDLDGTILDVAPRYHHVHRATVRALGAESQTSLDSFWEKKRLGWTPPEKPFNRRGDLFSTFRALPDPLVPKPGDEVMLRFDWPARTRIRSGRVRIQTDPFGPWIKVAEARAGTAPERLRIGRFDRATPVSYRVDIEADGDRSVELWGYFQVRIDQSQNPLPTGPLLDAPLTDARRDPDPPEGKPKGPQ